MGLPYLTAAKDAGATVTRANASMDAPLTPEQVRYARAEIYSHTTHDHPEFAAIRSEGLKQVADAAKDALQSIVQA